ncbi:arginine--tRNA ligase [Spirochaetota bacterium]|nr:arginine--tRNA ligase [Spirochaetota bacterium]
MLFIPLQVLKEAFLSTLAKSLCKAYPNLTEVTLRKEFVLTECNPKHKGGDLATPLPFKLARYIKKTPNQVAAELITILSDPTYNTPLTDLKLAPKFVIAGAGYLNITLNPTYKETLIRAYFEHLANKSPQLPASNRAPRKKKILLEYISANPTGPLHIGHGRWAAYGSTLANILRFTGHEVYEEFYVNDMGNQIEQLNQTVAALRSNKPIPKEGYHSAYLNIFKDPATTTSIPIEVILKEQQQTLHNMRVTFNAPTKEEFSNHFFRESSISDETDIQQMIKFLKAKELAYEKEGALWFAAKREGNDDKDRVIVKTDGTYTYFFIDMLYHYSKLKRGYTHLIDILGADHHGYTKRIKIASSLIYKHLIAAQKKEDASLQEQPTPPFKMDVLIGQLVNLYRSGKPVRMSKRTGNIIELSTVAEEIGVDAIRYFLVHQDIASPLDFDIDKAKSQSLDNPVYYIQYAYARTCSLFHKAQTLGILPANLKPLAPQHYAENTAPHTSLQVAIKDLKIDYALIESPTVNRILYKLITFNEELALISTSYQVHHLPRFLHDLASLFHKLYNETSFLTPKEDISPAEKKLRPTAYLLLSSAVGLTLQNGLSLMNITAPVKM